MHRLLVPALALSALLFIDPVLAQDAPPSGRSLSSPGEQRQADEAMNTPSGRAGQDEPGVHAPTSNAAPVLKDGKLTVPSAPPSGRSLSSPGEQRQADEAMNTPSGRAGQDEPGVHVPTSNVPPVLKDGKLTVPSAPSQSQTTPDAPQGTIGKSQ
jgi:hypothetical protein